MVMLMLAVEGCSFTAPSPLRLFFVLTGRGAF